MPKLHDKPRKEPSRYRRLKEQRLAGLSERASKGLDLTTAEPAGEPAVEYQGRRGRPARTPRSPGKRPGAYLAALVKLLAFHAARGRHPAQVRVFAPQQRRV
jgi:hypothetical protein